MSTPVPITVFGRARGCGQCIATKRHLDKQGTPYEYVDVDTSTDGADRVRALGYIGVPVVEAGDMHWHGYRPDKLDQLGRIHTYAPDVADLDQTAATFLAEAT